MRSEQAVDKGAACRRQDCGLGEEASEGLSPRERRRCKGSLGGSRSMNVDLRAFNRLSKRSSFLGVPVAFLQQLSTCGRCAICETFAKARWPWPLC